MKYIYYPGCSLEGTAREYDISTRSLMRACGAELIDLSDWTCCGATAAEPTGYFLSMALPARNLALAEMMDHVDILVPCSACYLNLKKVEEKIRVDTDLLQKINMILAENNLKLEGRVQVRHLLDVIVNDVGSRKVASLVEKNLSGLKIAPYYGCQCLRPYPVFDNPENPTSMEPILKAMGAEIHVWDMGGKCCGASHMNTKPEVGVKLVSGILEAADGADAIVTVCPMCQMNLDAYQKDASRNSGRDLSISVLYLPQVMGIALGLTEKDLGINHNLTILNDFKKRIKHE
jgi:heterodisulfide reductase subunit B